MGRPRTDPLIRFFNLVQPQEDGCLLWVGKIKPGPQGGYGIFSPSPEEKSVRAHVWLMKVLFNLSAPMLHHLCHNKACVAWWHLEPINPTDHNQLHNRRAFCGRGHEMKGVNIYIDPKRGWRQCRTCRNQTWSVKKPCITHGCTTKSRKDGLCLRHQSASVKG